MYARMGKRLLTIYWTPNIILTNHICPDILQHAFGNLLSIHQVYCRRSKQQFFLYELSRFHQSTHGVNNCFYCIFFNTKQNKLSEKGIVLLKTYKSFLHHHAFGHALESKSKKMYLLFPMKKS